jgi:hypothetical protein
VRVSRQCLGRVRMKGKKSEWLVEVSCTRARLKEKEVVQVGSR